jgi:CheY-like chemotaxis protein
LLLNGWISKMNENRPSEPKTESAEIIPAAASELNNLLQIIAGTAAMLENIWDGTPGSEKYFDMLRLSVDRAAEVTAQLVKQVGGTSKKVLLRPELATFAKGMPLPRPTRGKMRCVMVVDDEPMALILAKQVLEQAGFDVVTAQSGFEAVDLFRKHLGRFDLILLDLSMPIMDGEETFNRLCAIDSQVVVLLNTGFIEKHRLDRMIAAGLAGFLRRPYRPSEVIEQIQSVLESVKRSRTDASPDAVAASS